MMYVKHPLSLRNVEDLMLERGIDIYHETVRLWWSRFGRMFAAEIRKKRVDRMRAHTHWRWRLDVVYVKINGETRYLWRGVDHEREATQRPAWDRLVPDFDTTLGKQYLHVPQTQGEAEIVSAVAGAAEV